MSPEIASASSVEAMIRAGAAALSNSRSPRLDARILARRVLDLDDAGLIARAHDRVSDEVKSAYGDLILRRAGGEPVAYIVGEKEFWGLDFRVGPGVLIPRADSECLIEAVQARRDRLAALRILDLGTGSGCLLCALLSEYRQATGLGVDLSPVAIEMARANAGRLGFATRAEFRLSDWFENVDGRFDVIIANAPYIPEGDRAGLMLDVSEYEPDLALFAGADGLDAYRRIFAELVRYLRPGGVICAEYGTSGQGEAIREMLVRAAPGAQISIIRDLAARERGVIVQIPDMGRD